MNHSPSAAGKAVSRPLDILIVDDSQEDFDAVRRQLRSGSFGKYAVRHCASALQALADCLRQSPDCLLLDLSMPELDGIRFLDRLAPEGAVRFPVIVMTSYGDEGAAAQALQRGAQDFLIKGETTPELLSRSIEHARERFRITVELAASHTELLATNAELRHSSERLDALFSQSVVGIAQTDLSGRFTLANEAFCALLGRSRQQILTTRLQDLDPSFASQSALIIAERDKQYQRPDGSLIWVHESISPIRNARGEASGRVFVARDITARKTAEEAQALLGAVAEASADAIVYHDLDGIIRAWNSGAEKTYGYSAHHAIGQPFELIVPPDKIEETALLRREATNSRPLRGFETFRLHRDGNRVPVAVTFSAVRDKSGELIGFSSISRDISKRKEAEEALRKSEASYRQLANSMPQIVYTCNAAGEATFVNQMWSEYTGVSSEDALRFDWVAHLHPEDQQPTGKKWAKAFAGSTAFETEYRLRNAGGEYRWHLSRAVAVKDAAGNITSWIGTSTDIHDRKLAEARLRLSEERLRLAQTAAGIGIWDLDLLQNRYAELPDFYEQFEFEPGEEYGFEDWLNRLHPGDRERVLQVTQEPAQYTSGLEMDFRVLRKDGTVRWYLGKGSTVTDGQNRPVRVTGINVDITERKRVEAEVKESRERLHLALRAARMGIWEWNVSRDLVTCSDEIARLFGHPEPPSECSLHAFLQQVHPVDRDLLIKQLCRCTERDAPCAAEFRVLRPDGGIAWIELQGGLERGEAGSPIRLIGTARDITEKKSLEQKLAAAEKFESIGVMAAGLAHDFNNLLVSVIGTTSLVQDILPPDHEAADLLLDVVAAGERAALLTSQMLAYSGKGQFRKEPTDVAQVVREAVISIQAKVRPATDVVLDLQPAQVTIGDPGQIRQVMVSLLTNAAESLDKSPGNITVRVRTQRIDQRYIDRVLRNGDISPGSFISIEVRDTGCGIHESIKDRVFEPFFSTKFAGRGLGLAAAAGIVRAHRGAIQLVSVPGSGTTVTVLLPASSAEQPDLPSPIASPVHSSSQTVLIVDDEDVVAKVAAGSLRRGGHRALMASSGAEALDAIRKHGDEISLVLLDLTMPGMSGPEVLQGIRRLNCDVPVILSSGYSQEDAFARIQRNQVLGFIQKPYSPKELLRKINESLKLSAAD